MEANFSFGLWVEKRRKALDLTRVELARKIGCSLSALRKIESDERRPSKQLAGLLADALDVPAEERPMFIRIARGLSSIERLNAELPLPTLSSLQSFQTISKPIPIPPTPLIGRETELAALHQMMNDPHCRFITLVGPGGSGKTRLATEIALEQSDNAVFVPLASVDSTTLLVQTVADALGFVFLGNDNPRAQLVNYLREKQLLLVLDNMEHLLEGADLIAEILESAPRLKMICTSREPLKLRGEWVFEVGGLNFPSEENVEDAGDYAANILFADCAQRADARFVLTAEDLPIVTRICTLVEGMPLAIELSATWVRTLPCREIAQEIERGLDILFTSARDVPERHHSMEAVFDHSWELLSTEERDVLSRLSVFRGGFTRETGEDVAGASLTVLSSLVSKSLLRTVEAGRYDLHELIRQYTLVRLMTNPKIFEATKERYLKFYLSLAEAADSQLRGPSQLEWLDKLDKEHDNLRSALEWSLEDGHNSLNMHHSIALRLAGALRWFWQIRSYFHEGCAWLEKALDHNKPGFPAVSMSSERTSLEDESHLQNLQAQACALEGLALLTNSLGNHSIAHTLAEQSAALYRVLDDKQGLADALMILGQTQHWQGEESSAHSILREALAIYRNVGDQWNIARSLYCLGTYLADFGGDVTGRAMLDESSAILEKLGDKYLFVNVLVAQGVVALGSCNYPQAREYFERSLTIAHDIGDPWEIADALTNIGCILRIQGDYASASSHFEEAFRIYQEGGRGLWCSDPLCALAENDIAQGHLADAHLHLQDASEYAKMSENRWVQTLVRYFQGLLAYYEGDLERSTMWLEEAIALTRESQYKPDLARSIVTLGRVMKARGESTRAEMLLGEGLSLFQKIDSKLGVAIALEGFVELVLPEDPKNALHFMKAAETIRDMIGAPLQPIDRSSYESSIAIIRAKLSEKVFSETLAQAREKPWTAVVMGILTNSKSGYQNDL